MKQRLRRLSKLKHTDYYPLFRKYYTSAKYKSLISQTKQRVLQFRREVLSK